MIFFILFFVKFKGILIKCKKRIFGVKKNLISVVLGSYNRYEFLKLTIDSVREELKDINNEIIVIDGGSTDGALEWLLKQKDIITIVQHNRGEWNGKKIERRSWGYFMNLGFSAAGSKYVCMISDDCLIVPGAIKNGYDLFEKKLSKGEKIGAVAFYWRDTYKRNKYHVGYTLSEKMYVNHGMYLKKALQEVDFIDEENFFFYNADADLCLKLLQKGYKTISSPKSFIEHFPHANDKVRSSNYEKQQLDNQNFFNKWNGIYYDKSKHNIGKIEYKIFKDKFNTFKKFEPYYEKLKKENPNLFVRKKINFIYRLNKKLKNILLMDKLL
ncbi:glycosyltransferase [Candidatus Dependentiae bacterium]|nr:glycosyltransferase [Candidatus Dependentiae bacterium]